MGNFARVGAVLLTACAAATASAEEILGITTDNAIVAFDSANPGTVLGSRRIAGLDSFVAAIAVRPADGSLYALTDGRRLYRVDRVSGLATPIGAGPIVPTLLGPASMSFDPATDELRIVTIFAQNLRVRPADGAVIDGDPVRTGTQPDGALAYDPSDVAAGLAPRPVAVAHLGGFSVGTSTCFVVDAAAVGSLARLGDPESSGGARNAGVLHTAGPLRFTAATNGFDISAATGRAYLAVTIPGEQKSKLFEVSLFTGGATLIGDVGTATPLRSIAVDPMAADLSARRVGLVALTDGGELIRLRSDDPTKITNRVALSGLEPGDALVAIAMRPTVGRLYGLSSGNRLYVLNSLTGVARAVRSTPFEVPLEGTRFGFDFSPTSNVARIVSDTGQNMRITPDTGAVVDGDPATPGIQPDAPLHFADDDPRAGPVPNVVALAFLRSAAGTTLFGIDATFDVLVRQGAVGGAANGGVLRTIGVLDVDATGPAAFEIVDQSTAFAAFATSGGAFGLHSIDLGTGVATRVGDIGLSETIRGLAVEPRSNPRTFGDALRVTTMTVRLDARRDDGDFVTIAGSMPFPDGGRGGRHVVLDVGGFVKEFDLNAGGAARDGAGTATPSDDDSFKFVGAPSDGRINFRAALRREQLSDDLADEGMGVDADVRGVTRVLRVTITVDGAAHPTDLTLRYSARSGATGSATLP